MINGSKLCGFGCHTNKNAIDGNNNQDQKCKNYIASFLEFRHFFLFSINIICNALGFLIKISNFTQRNNKTAIREVENRGGENIVLDGLCM